MSDYLAVEISKRSLAEMAPRMKVLAEYMPAYVSELEEWQAKAREYSEKHIRPKALEIDRKCTLDPDYVDWDLLKESTPYGFLSMLVPKGVGGGGQIAVGAGIVLEEMCAACAGIANIFGANALGVSGMLLGMDFYHYDRCLRDLVDGDKKGEPVIFAAAITEPLAGSDVEDAVYIKSAKLMTEARPTEGGYLLNGRKVFISNGSIAKYTAVIAPLDRKNPDESQSAFVVKMGDPGFSIGRVEKKMGQKACPAAEQIFEDCFVPKDMIIGSEGESMAFTDMVLGASRGPVGAIATGIARGAFERIYEYAKQKKVGGRRLIDHQWVHIKLAEMARKIHLARQAYIDACMMFDFYGVPKMMKDFQTRMLLDGLPGSWRRGGMLTKLLRSKWMKKTKSKMFERLIAPEDLRNIQVYSSIAKISGSDVAVEVAYEALQIAGLEGGLQTLELEKIYRDAKLTQIYEGTNQLNRHNIFINQFPGEVSYGE